MIYLLQILKMIDDLDYFQSIFEDLDFELNEQGWKDSPDQLICDLLGNHFGITMECDKQLAILTNCILKKGNVKAAIRVTLMQKGESNEGYIKISS